ncbi:hypothetical protein [Pseudomonas sp. BF-R-21]|uniref:hypothetical protein n=1 Tax=Pseudomonas sp. BF-R-21 TaxID=2832387 RepID=UPI001CBC1C5A|nr:hypothetical protein [Pseudomonas sp. BF-R-21]
MTTKALPTSKTLRGVDVDPTLQENRAKMRRLPVDMPSADLRAFGDEARDKGMSMRRYFYWLWDKHTGNKRSQAVFDE